MPSPANIYEGLEKTVLFNFDSKNK